MLRKILRGITSQVKVRGRHRLVQHMGKLLASPPYHELLNIDGFNVEIDHSIEFNRYVYYHLYEEYFLGFLDKILRKGDVFFDPGTNIGYITAIASSLVGEKGQVYSFEPSKLCYERLKLSNPKLKNNIHLFHAALSNRTGKAIFNDTPRALTRGFACLEEVDHPDDSDSYEVETWSLDDFCSKFNINHIRCLKLDIEGSELLALQGASKLLASHKIDYMLVETEIKDTTRQRQKKIVRLLTGYNYLPHKLKAGGKLVEHFPLLAADYTEDYIWVRSGI